PGTLLGQRQRRGTTNAAGGTGDKTVAITKCFHAVPPKPKARVYPRARRKPVRRSRLAQASRLTSCSPRLCSEHTLTGSRHALQRSPAARRWLDRPGNPASASAAARRTRGAVPHPVTGVTLVRAPGAAAYFSGYEH